MAEKATGRLAERKSKEKEGGKEMKKEPIKGIKITPDEGFSLKINRGNHFAYVDGPITMLEGISSFSENDVVEIPFEEYQKIRKDPGYTLSLLE